MSRKREKKARAAPSSAPVPVAVEAPGVAVNRSPELESHPPILNDRRTVLVVCLFLAAMVWAVFGQTLEYEFVNYDDNLYITDNPAVLRGLSLRGIAWALTHIVNFSWTPLDVVSHMLDCQLYGTNAGWHHLTSVLLHLASVIALFLVVKEMTGFLWRGAFVAAVFAVHPLRVESVAWIAERRDVLSGLFFMLTIGAYVRYAKEFKIQSSKFKVFYSLCLVFFVLGLMSKPMVVTLPFVLLLLDYWPLQRLTASDGPQVAWRLIAEKLPMLAIGGVFCLATLFAQKEAIVPLPLSVRLGNALVSCVVYLGQMLYPARLAVLYPHPGNSLPLWHIMLAFVLLSGLSAVAVAGWRARPWLLVGWLWYLGMLVPVIGLVQQGLRAHADRYTYLPQIGLSLALTWAAADLSAGWRCRRVALGGLAVVILAALVFCARVQVSYWRNSESLWTHTLACTTDNAVAHDNLGHALLEKGKVDEAIGHFQQALQIKPDFANACNNLGLALFEKGKIEEAMAQYLRALQIKPDDADAHNNLGLALFQEGRTDEAMAHYRQALQIKPDHAEAHYNLGLALFQKGSIEEAIGQFKKALEAKPDYADAHNNLGLALFQEGKTDEATAQYRQALQIKPDHLEAHYNLGLALFQKGSMDEAIGQLQKALQIKPDYAEAHVNLGLALFQEGKMDAAMAHYERALQIKPDLAEAHNSLGLTLFQKGRMDEARSHYQQALRIKPDYVEALNNLAWLLATAPKVALRDGRKAVELAQRANQLAGEGNPVILGTLAAAYAEAGRFSEAVQAAQHSLQLAQTEANTALAAAVRSQLKLYQAGLPFHSN
jgi:protein O-mannosyl-transferase